MAQLVLFPDARPLVERLGRDFFRQAPVSPGVYLMRDSAETVLYVGKARNLRQRLGAYRVANPDRLARRHMRLLRATARVELRLCPDEAAALELESKLLKELRPRFNRAGTWTPPPRVLGWRAGANQLEFALAGRIVEGWNCLAPTGGMAVFRAALCRLIWVGLRPGSDYFGLPAGWLGPRQPRSEVVSVSGDGSRIAEAAQLLGRLFEGHHAAFSDWISASESMHPLEAAIRAADLEYVRRKVETVVLGGAALSEASNLCRAGSEHMARDLAMQNCGGS